MAKTMRACRLGHASFLHRLFHRLLQDRFVQMVPALLSGNPVDIMTGRWKHPLPTPLFSRVWVFALQGIGQSDSAQASLKIALVLSSYHFKVLCERFFHCRGKHCVSILVALTSPDYNLVTGKVNVFDSQP